MTLTASVDSIPFSLDLSGQVRKGHDSLTLKADASYGFDGQQEWTTLGVDGKYVAASLGQLDKHSFFLAVDVSTYFHIPIYVKLARLLSASLIQHRDFPMELTWDTQLSRDYLSNMGKLTVGSARSYELEQIFSSQDNGDDYKEILFKVALASPFSGHEYKIDYVQKVSSAFFKFFLYDILELSLKCPFFFAAKRIQFLCGPTS